MRQDIFDWLEGLARASTRSTRHEDGYKRFGYDPKNPDELREFHKELALCSEITYEKHGFMISVLVVRKDGTVPGGDFFDLARHLGESLERRAAHEMIFYADQLHKTFTHYSK